MESETLQATKSPEVAPRRRERTDEARGSTRVVILAGGDGTRLRSLTRALAGDDRPKQFCALAGRDPMVVQAVRRAALIAPSEQILIVLNRRHEEWYREIFDGTPASSLVVQPENRGTGTAVLYALLRIAGETPNAPVVILPSDHWVSNDSAFMLYAQAAVGVVEAHTNVVALLGVEPTRAEGQYGWIEPGESILGDWRGLSRVARFVEKPSPELAEALLRRGTSLWNTSVVVGQAEQLMLLFAMAKPALVGLLPGDLDGARIARGSGRGRADVRRPAARGPVAARSGSPAGRPLRAQGPRDRVGGPGPPAGPRRSAPAPDAAAGAARPGSRARTGERAPRLHVGVGRSAAGTKKTAPPEGRRPFAVRVDQLQ